MSFSYPLTMPTSPAPKSMTPGWDHAQGITESEFDYSDQVTDWGGEVWEFIGVQLPPMLRAQAMEWVAFFGKLYGQVGSFLFSPPGYKTPRGGWGADSPQVDGADQTGNLLNIKNLTHSQTGWGKKGDFFQLNSGANARLHMLLDDFSTNASGEALIACKPAITVAPNDASSIVLINPAGVFRLVSPKQNWSVDLLKHGVTFDCRSIP